jgi:hypothetical protein
MDHWTAFRAGDSGEHRRRSRVAVSGFRGGDPVWWGSQTSTGATPESAWKWRAPSATHVPAQACCRWRRSGFAWPTGCRPTLKMNPIGRRLKSRWLCLVRELGPRQRHLVQDPAVALALHLFSQAPAFLGKAAILCGRVHLWRQPGRPLMRSGCMRVMPPGTFSTGAGRVARARHSYRGSYCEGSCRNAVPQAQARTTATRRNSARPRSRRPRASCTHPHR